MNPRPLHMRGNKLDTRRKLPRMYKHTPNVGRVTDENPLAEWEALMGAPDYDPTDQNLTWTERESTLVRGTPTHTRKHNRK